MLDRGPTATTVTGPVWCSPAAHRAIAATWLACKPKRPVADRGNQQGEEEVPLGDLRFAEVERIDGQHPIAGGQEPPDLARRRLPGRASATRIAVFLASASRQLHGRAPSMPPPICSRQNVAFTPSFSSLPEAIAWTW